MAEQLLIKADMAWGWSERSFKINLQWANSLTIIQKAIQTQGSSFLKLKTENSKLKTISNPWGLILAAVEKAVTNYGLVAGGNALWMETWTGANSEIQVLQVA